MDSYRDPLFVPAVSILATQGRNVHGVCQLPPGYALAIVPLGTEVLDIGDNYDEKARSTEEHCIEERNNEDRDIEIQENEGIVNRGDGEQDEEGRNNEVRNDENRDGEKQDEGRQDSQERDHRDPGNMVRLIWILRNLPLLQLRQMQKQRRLARDILRADPASHVPQLSSANNLAKGLVAIFQSLYAVVTLYRARGNQIEQYGFAAFGLTVSPYLIMSIVNLFSTLLTPDYPTTYLVKFEAMVEASKREGAKFEGVVGSIRSRRQIPELIGTIKFVNADDGRMLLTVGPRARQGPSSGLPTRFVMDQIRSPSPPWSRNPIERPALMISSCLEIDVTGEERKERHELRYIGRASAAVTSISIAINGALSHFKSGHSTLTQRVWTMTWLACGILFGSLATGFEIDSSGKLGMLFYGAPSIGGFVIVAQMLKEYGHCVQLFGEDI